MKIGIEISMYPFNEEYKTPIRSFIENLKNNTNLEIVTNNLSTQIFGEYDELTELVRNKILAVFEKQKAVFVMKWVGGPSDIFAE